MIYYLFLFILTYLLSFLDLSNVKYKHKQMLFLFIAFILILFAGLRYEIGFDYFSYFRIFTDSHNLNNIFSHGIEPGFYLLNWFFNLFFNNFYFLIFFIALVTIVLKVNFINKYSIYIFIPLFYYYALDFLPREMGQIRHALAISILLFSIKYIFEEDFLKFIFLIIIATSIHYTSLIFIPAYFFNKIKLDKKKMLFLITFSLGLALININDIILYLANIMPQIDPVESVIRYINRPGRTGRIGISLTVIWRVFLFGVSFIFYSEIFHTKKKRNIFDLYFLGLLIYFSLNGNAMFARRFAQVYMFLEGIIISYIIFSLKRKETKILFMIFLGIVMSVRFYGILLNSVFHDYKTIFSILFY